MTKKIKFGITILAICCLFLSCKQEPDFNTFPIVSYSADIAPIISGNCTFSGCHGDSASREFKLHTFEDVMKYCKVSPGKPQGSRLYLSIISLDEERMMPKPPYSLLTEKQIQLIYVWIGQGAKYN